MHLHTTDREVSIVRPYAGARSKTYSAHSRTYLLTNYAKLTAQEYADARTELILFSLTSFEVVDGFCQRIDRLDIQVIGRFVQYQHIWCSSSQFSQCHSGLLSTRQVANLDGMSMTSQAKFTQTLSGFLVAEVEESLEVLGGTFGQRKMFTTVLIEASDPCSGIASNFALIRLDVSTEKLEESGLSHTVWSDDGYSRCHVDTEVEVFEDGWLVSILKRHTCKTPSRQKQ